MPRIANVFSFVFATIFIVSVKNDILRIIAN